MTPVELQTRPAEPAKQNRLLRSLVATRADHVPFWPPEAQSANGQGLGTNSNDASVLNWLGAGPFSKNKYLHLFP